MKSFERLIASGDFMPSGVCYLWNSSLVWLHAISDSLIALSCFAILFILLWFVRKRRDLPYAGMIILSGPFLIACGFTHLMDVWNIWHANYWLAGVVKAITAAASVPTAILFVQFLPRALNLPSINQWAQENAALEEEVRDRRDMELGLRVSEARYREQAELLDLTFDSIMVRDLENRVAYWNLGAERFYGWTKEEARGKVTHSLFQTVFPKPLAEIDSELFKTGSWEGELIHRRRDGSEVVVLSRWILRRDMSGKPEAILESNRDITQRKQEEAKFRNLLEAAPDSIVIVNREGLIQIVNAQTEKLFGYKRDELIGQPVEMLVPHRLRDRHIGHRQSYSRAPTQKPMGIGLELYGQCKDGTEFPVEVSLSPLETEKGVLISSAIRDVTDRRKAEEEIRKLNAELSKKLAEIEIVNKELESFSYSVSHDLRAPLRHIDGFARIVKEEHAAGLSADGGRYLDRILHAANQMGHLVDDLLTLSRIGRGQIAVQKAKMSEIVREAMRDLPTGTEKRKIEWKISPLPEVECDPSLLRLVLSNLLSNAAKFTRKRPNAVIEIGTCLAGGATAFFVRDNGVGFDPKYADKLFGVFQRLHRAEDFEGTGIGLATAQRIISRHGGQIWAESQPGHGATFYFTLGYRPTPPMSEKK